MGESAVEPANKLRSADRKRMISYKPIILRLIDKMSHEIITVSVGNFL